MATRWSLRPAGPWAWALVAVLVVLVSPGPPQKVLGAGHALVVVPGGLQAWCWWKQASLRALTVRPVLPPSPKSCVGQIQARVCDDSSSDELLRCGAFEFVWRARQRSAGPSLLTQRRSTLAPIVSDGERWCRCGSPPGHDETLIFVCSGFTSIALDALRPRAPLGSVLSLLPHARARAR
jgi:hypothetical protein